MLRVDLDIPRLMLVGRAQTEDDSALDYNDLYEMYHARFESFKTSFFAFLERGICLFIDARDERRIPALVNEMSADAKRILGVPLIFGAGRVEESSSLYWRSYDEACSALEWLSFDQAGSLMRYEDMDLGLILSSVPNDNAAQLVEHVFRGLSEDEIDEYQRVFDAYVRHNGSIVHCAEELFLHKNTLQNRLNKIADKTGYNPRRLADFEPLALAFLLRRYLKR